MNTIAQATEGKKLHHSALARGYVSRKTEGVVEQYEGRFGKGVKVCKPNFGSSRYMIVEYWIAA